MRLGRLIAEIPAARVEGSLEHEVTGLAYDSRRVAPGYLFVAIRGTHVDGHDYIEQALARGAIAVVLEATRLDHSLRERYPQITLIGVAQPRIALAPLAACWYGFPGRRMRVVGITGTDGKTTTSRLTAAALEASGKPSGMLGTVDFKIGGRIWANDSRQSTPEALEVQALLHEMANAGCAYAVLEATSHALSEQWQRLSGSAFDIALLTNVTSEHLDYHGSVEAYRQAKANLFRLLGEFGGETKTPKQHKVAIVNADDPQHQLFLDAAPAQAVRLRYAITQAAEIRAEQIQLRADGTQFHVKSDWGATTLRLQLPGEFNVSNALAALSVALVEGVPLAAAAQALAALPGVRGRMQRIDAGQPFGVLVDYAHTPGAFEKLLPMVRNLTTRRLIAVFGSAGERDRDKRAVQGAIAARYCDLLVLTDEDPRGEDREAIIAEIARGAEQAGKRAGVGYWCIADRAAAIQAALAAAQPGDLVLLLGKGHEGSIIDANGAQPWDEARVAYAALSQLGYQRPASE